ncbi:universal stress protein [Halomarina halobia]|uniref:Universal stress protein n=1 Tax=Halomarina halobia TaxID=3033386 RepID=A0ABD6AEA9_9EURY|nr:universal stress protein [Halomarina sp. PSR21]
MKPYDPNDIPETVTSASEQLEVSAIEATVRRERGNPAAYIVAVAAEADAGNMLIGGRKWSLIRRALLGSTTQPVVLSAERSVSLGK